MTRAAKNKPVSFPFMQDLCSLCGLCMVKAWPARDSKRACVFTTGWLGTKERELFGRERHQENIDETRFGISIKRCVARLRNPVPKTQFTGIITRMAQKAFEAGLVEAVVTLHRNRQDYFFPEPVLARSTAAILASGGSKPVLASSLIALARWRKPAGRVYESFWLSVRPARFTTFAVLPRRIPGFRGPSCIPSVFPV